jgi:hypothetical protein
VARFAITPAEIAQLETKLTLATDTDKLAATVANVVMRGFKRTCFTIMSFVPRYLPVWEQAIRLAAEEALFFPLRTDVVLQHGEVTGKIRSGIQNCTFAVADLSDQRPNVMYEVGLAHAYNKPVVMLIRRDQEGRLKEIPFDVRTHVVHRYSLENLPDLLSRLTPIMRGFLAMESPQTG